jgi:hypothetical protein
MEIIDKIENPVEIVNQLITKSFGRWWKSNCHFDGSNYFYPNKTSFLHILAKPSKFGNGYLHHDESYTKSKYMKVAGQLGDGNGFGDGSIIAVFLDYKSQAEKYCKLYEDFFKKETKIIIASDLDYSPGHSNFPFKKYSASEKENELTKIEGLEKQIIDSRAKNIGEVILSLSINEQGILGFNGYMNEQQKQQEYQKIVDSMNFEKRMSLAQKLSDDLPYLKMIETKTPLIVQRYFERFNDSVESIQDLELFQRALLEAK